MSFWQIVFSRFLTKAELPGNQPHDPTPQSGPELRWGEGPRVKVGEGGSLYFSRGIPTLV